MEVVVATEVDVAPGAEVPGGGGVELVVREGHEGVCDVVEDCAVGGAVGGFGAVGGQVVAAAIKGLGRKQDPPVEGAQVEVCSVLAEGFGAAVVDGDVDAAFVARGHDGRTCACFFVCVVLGGICVCKRSRKALNVGFLLELLLL